MQLDDIIDNLGKFNELAWDKSFKIKVWIRERFQSAKASCPEQVFYNTDLDTILALYEASQQLEIFG